MIDGSAARFVRRWVELYTRGLPAELRDGRREEIDGDLWSQAEEARLIGRSHRSTSGEILVRLIAGLPADVTWRLAHRGGDRERLKHERDARSGIHVPELLAIVGGLSFGLYAALVVLLGVTTPGMRIDDVYRELIPFVFAILLGSGGIIVIALATFGLVLLFQERINPVVAIAGSIGAAGGLLGAFGGAPAVLVWFGSAALVWNLALVGVVGRRLAAAHVLSVGILLVSFVVLVSDGSMVSFALAFPYAITLVAIGVSMDRGVPTIEPARGASRR
jgi:hypothetical protein